LSGIETEHIDTTGGVAASQNGIGDLHRAMTPERTPGRRLLRAFGVRNVSALYVGIGFFVLFSLWVPDLFLTSTTFRSLLTQQAIVAIVAIGIVLPLAAGAYDLSVGLALGTGSIICAWLIGDHGMAVAPAVILSVLSGTGIGLLNSVLVTLLNVDSFIATLATTSMLTALVNAVSNGEQIIGLPDSLQKISNTQVFGIALPVYMMLVLACVLWYLLDHTPVGRRIYATGGNPEAARLAGIRVRLVTAATLVVGSSIAAFAGVLLTAQTGASAPDVGPGYLLPAFSAAFLGSTQIRNGMFNVWGTVLAVYVLAIGVKGLQLAGAPVWLPDLFNGVALAIAVAAAKWQGKPRLLLRRSWRKMPPAPVATTGGTS
jgi:ribose transport system permease protein